MSRYLFLICCILSFFVSAAQTYEGAIELLRNNKRADAIAMLKRVEASVKNKGKAALALSVIEADEEHYLEAFQDFRIFFQEKQDAYPYVYPMASLGIFSEGDSRKSPEVRMFLEQLVADTNVHATVKSCLINTLALNAQSTGDIAKSKDIYSQLNELKHWSSAGAFGNIGGSGFNKYTEALTHPEDTHTFVNNTGAKVQWFEIPEVKNDRWLDFAYTYSTIDAIIYSQTFMKSDTDKEVLLLVGVSGSLKIWLNDFEVASESEEANTDMDMLTYKVRLQKGCNRLLLQTGSSEITKNNLIVRIADLQGNILRNVTTSSHYEPYVKASPYPIIKKEFFVEKYFEYLVSQRSDDLINQYLLLEIYNHNGQRLKAQDKGDEMEKMAWQSTFVRRKALSTAVIFHNDRDAGRERTFIREHDESSFQGLSILFYDLLDKGKFNGADSLLKKVVAGYGGSAGIEIKQLTMLEKENAGAQYLAELKKAYNRYPGNEDIVMRKFRSLYYLSRDRKRGVAALSNYLQDNYSMKMTDTLVEAYIDCDEKENAIEVLQQQIGNRLFAVNRFFRLSGIYEELHDYNNAIYWAKKGLAASPYGTVYYHQTALLDAARGDTAEAIEMMKACLLYDPGNHDARNELMILQHKKPISHYFVQNDIDKLYKDALSDRTYDSLPGVILLSDFQNISHGNEAYEVHRESLTYLSNQAIAGSYKEYNIPFNSSYEKLIIENVEILKPDGRKISLAAKNGHIDYGKLEARDAVHLKYRVDGLRNGDMSKHFWFTYYMNALMQEQVSRCTLALPAGTFFNIDVSDKQLKPQFAQVDGYDIYTWEKRNIPKIENEPYATDEVYDKIEVSSVPDWNTISNYLSDMVYSVIQPTIEIKKAVDDALFGYQHQSEIRKAEVIYNYIDDNYSSAKSSRSHYSFIPQKPYITLKEKAGTEKDLCALYVSMLRAAGLNAEFVLVKKKEPKANNYKFPRIDFEHYIARLKIGEDVYFIDPTKFGMPFLALDASVLKAHGLILSDSIGEKVYVDEIDFPARKKNVLFSRSEITLGDSVSLIHSMTGRTAGLAAKFRSDNRKLTSNERTKQLADGLGKVFNKPVKISNWKIADQNNLETLLTEEYDISVSGYGDSVLNMYAFKIPWTDARFSWPMFAPEKRKYTLDISTATFFNIENDIVIVNIPSGNKIEIPQDAEVHTTAFDYKLTFKLKDNKLIVERRVEFLKYSVSPDEYAAFKTGISKVKELDSQSIIAR